MEYFRSLLRIITFNSFFKIVKQKKNKGKHRTWVYLKNVVSLEFDSSKCTKCKMCINVCPHAVFTFDTDKIKITNRDKCMECGACMKNCSFDAVKVDSGVGCAEAIIYSILTGKKPKCGCTQSDNNKEESSC
jgi:ferredoxin